MNVHADARDFDHRRLRNAVESAPDYPEAAAAAAQCQAAKEQADAAHRAALQKVSAIWDREACRLFGAPDRQHATAPRHGRNPS